MGQLRRVPFSHNPNDVKSRSMVVEVETRKIMLGGHSDLTLLPLIDRGQRVSEFPRTVRPNLNEDKRFFILRDEINFPTGASIIFLNYHIAEGA